MPRLCELTAPGLLVFWIMAEWSCDVPHGTSRGPWLLVLAELPRLVEFSRGVVREDSEGRQVSRDERRRNVDDSVVVMVKVLSLRDVAELLEQESVELLLVVLEYGSLVAGCQ